MNFDAFKRELVAHYTAMAQIPGAKEHAWFAVNDLARKYPREFSDLPTLLTRAMHAAKETA